MQFVNTSECVTYKWHCVDISSEKSQRKVFLQILYFHQHFLQKKKKRKETNYSLKSPFGGLWSATNIQI